MKVLICSAAAQINGYPVCLVNDERKVFEEWECEWESEREKWSSVVRQQQLQQQQEQLVGQLRKGDCILTLEEKRESGWWSQVKPMVADSLLLLLLVSRAQQAECEMWSTWTLHCEQPKAGTVCNHVLISNPNPKRLSVPCWSRLDWGCRWVQTDSRDSSEGTIRSLRALDHENELFCAEKWQM